MAKRATRGSAPTAKKSSKKSSKKKVPTKKSESKGKAGARAAVAARPSTTSPPPTPAPAVRPRQLPQRVEVRGAGIQGIAISLTRSGNVLHHCQRHGLGVEQGTAIVMLNEKGRLGRYSEVSDPERTFDREIVIIGREVTANSLNGEHGSVTFPADYATRGIQRTAGMLQPLSGAASDNHCYLVIPAGACLKPVPTGTTPLSSWVVLNACGTWRIVLPGEKR